MWKLIHDSATGTSHDRLAQPCQDHRGGITLTVGDEQVLIAVCSDGAGSACFSQDSSQAACLELIALISRDLENGLAIAQIDRKCFTGWYADVRAKIEVLASSMESPLREFACTLLGAVIGESNAVFAQLGDGAIVVLQNETYQTVFWPQSGEYANTTNFITDPGFDTRLEFAAYHHPIHELAMFTDGLQMLALDFQAKAVHGPFFVPLFRTLRKVEPDALKFPLQAFLTSDSVNKRTDDDKTLLLATRVNAHAP